MDLEFKSWLCIYETDYLKLVKVRSFEKVIYHNLIINSGMLLINLDILKFFMDDRNSFIIEERKKLGLVKKRNPQFEGRSY